MEKPEVAWTTIITLDPSPVVAVRYPAYWTPLMVIGWATKWVYATPLRVKWVCCRTASKLSLVTLPSEVVTAVFAVIVTPP